MKMKLGKILPMMCTVIKKILKYLKQRMKKKS